MSELESIKPRGLGLKVGGSATKGHVLTAKRDDALSEIFGTDQTEQINGLLSERGERVPALRGAFKANRRSLQRPSGERLVGLPILRRWRRPCGGHHAPVMEARHAVAGMDRGAAGD